MQSSPDRHPMNREYFAPVNRDSIQHPVPTAVPNSTITIAIPLT